MTSYWWIPSRGLARVGITLVALVGCLAASCRNDSEGPTRDVETAVDQRTVQAQSLEDLETARRLFRTDLEETERLLRPAEFKAKDGSGMTEVPLTCDRRDGSGGRSYVFKLRESAVPLEDPAGKARLVEDHWRGKGYAVTVRTAIGFDVQAVTKEGGILLFFASDRGMNLSGESACVQA
jgi:hypothetical protein